MTLPTAQDSTIDAEQPSSSIESTVNHLPVDGQLTYKGFGEYFEDRFSGYHVGIDFEAPAGTSVYAIVDGIVTSASRVTGYGGVMVVEHEINGHVVSAIYGHVDPSSMLAVGTVVQVRDQLAVLGEEGVQTDGEREHLHFAMYEGKDVRLKGYETRKEAVGNWLNPYEVLKIIDDTDARASDLIFDGADQFSIDVDVPAGWDIEYIPSIQALNLYTLADEGTARERSQILIRYFDASSFLTLSSVTIHSTQELTVGTGDYTARRYDIEKNANVTHFVDQPSWRNQRHIVTDVRLEDGYTRYYVVAKNPELDVQTYESLLESVTQR